MIYCLNFVKKNMEVFLNRHPHVREIHHQINNSFNINRITPACAGNTTFDDNPTLDDEDHPRMCGKYLAVFCASYAWLGSPPHVREIHFELQFRPLLSRITPACAGNTLEFDTKRKEKQDHPRMCGKYDD